MLGINSNSWAGVTATDVVCTGCVNDTDIATGAVSESKLGIGAVTNGKIGDGAVTDVKIAGPISANKIEKPANVLTVAQSGGDFTTISAALASLPDPNTTPVVIKVMPGTYTESAGIFMKSYVHLQGSGRDVTIIEGPIKISSVEDVAISGLKIRYPSYITGVYGAIHIATSSPVIKDNYFDGPNIVGVSAVYCASSSPTIEGNFFKDIPGRGIESNNSSTLIRNNTLINSGDDPVQEQNSSSTIIGNVFEGGGDHLLIENSNSKWINNVIKNGYGGLYISGNDPTKKPIVKGNIITGSTGEADINVIGIYITPNISFNIYDTFNGSGAVGMYNVKSDGTPAPLQ